MAESWNLVDIISYFQEDQEIKDGLTQDDIDRFSNPHSVFIGLLQAALQYQDFDPKTILKQLIRKNAQYKREHIVQTKWDLANVTGDFKWQHESLPANMFTNHEPVTKDAQLLIFTFLLRCNHISKTIQKSLPGVQGILEMLRLKYEINDEFRASGTTLQAADITLPRIAGTMPAVAVRLFHQKSVKETVQFLSIPGVQYEESTASTASGSTAPTTTIKTTSYHPCTL